MSQYLVDRDFDTLGYSDFDSLGSAYANDNRSVISKFVQGARELWCAVVEEAFRSADLSAWVRSRDFPLICELAGVDPDVMRMAASKVLGGEMQIAPKPGRNKHAGAK